MITLELVDQMRKRTNYSYEEGKILPWKKHNGDVLEAIVDFEKIKTAQKAAITTTTQEVCDRKKPG